MKALAFLVLAVFTGCQTNLSNAKEKPNPHLEHLVNAFWNYIVQAVHTTDETSQMNGTSKLEVNLTQTPPSEDLMTKITKETEVLRERLETDLNTVRDKLEPYADTLKSQIEERVEDLRAAMAPYAYFLNSETLRGNLEQSVKDIQAQLEPYTAELEDNVDQYLQEMKKSLAASTEDPNNN